jgi:predicted HTH transcriptional regulator
MARVSTAVEDAANLIRERITQLDAERKQLEEALSSLTGRLRRRRPGRPRGSTSTTATRTTGRRRRRGGTRADQAARMVKQNPGITASEIAKKMKIQPNYLYRVMADLEKQGRVKKDGRKYSPAE